MSHMQKVFIDTGNSDINESSKELVFTSFSKSVFQSFADGTDVVYVIHSYISLSGKNKTGSNPVVSTPPKLRECGVDIFEMFPKVRG